MIPGDDPHRQKERSAAELVAEFPAEYERMTRLMDSAARGNGSALAELRERAGRLHARTSALSVERLARHAVALETVARVEDVRHFDRGAASACLAALRDAFVELRDAQPAQPRGGAAARPLVLVADHDEEQRYLLTRILQRAGFDVVPAATGAESLTIARARKPAAIMLDVQMPDQDGFATGRLLRADASTATIPLMFLSAAPEADGPRLAAGAGEYAAKSLDPVELIARVRALCARLTPSAD